VNFNPFGFRERIRSLQVLITSTVVLGVLFAALIAYEYSADRLRDRHLIEVQAELAQVANLTALAMREPLWQFVPEQAESIIDSVFVNPYVLTIEVKDHAGVMFATRQRSELSSLSARGLTVETVKPILRDGSGIGQLRIVMSTAGYFSKLEETRSQYLRSTGLTVSIALIIILLVLQWNFVRPVNRLVVSSQLLAKGALHQPIVPSALTELGTLAHSLETTRQSLIQLFNDLERRNSELASVNIHLEMRVAERTKSLEDALKELGRAQNEIVQAEKLASLGRVVATVAHELNTPIGNALMVATTIEENIRNLRSEISQATPRRSVITALMDRSDQGLDVFLRSIQKAAALISSFKQVTAEQDNDFRGGFDLAAVTEGALRTLEGFTRKSSCQLILNLQPGVACEGFAGSFGKVVINLAMNAVLHGYPENGKGGRVIVETMSVGTDRAILIVRDEGVGMNEEVRQKIFDPFFTTRMGQGGSGLGMNIVHGLVTRTLGGTISVKSSPGLGTEITIIFPRVAP